ncbi:hypothetical protein IC619_002735 [Hazenella sp. IB182353]|uniref:hypothetical protein n=1 Tax=Polycladospora coralii TaxID=2771432 RepID=UPI001746EB6E|nr:hypothetical protein [Polycladospora coralii]MBS7529413.1 hypothetical protein [Polycladospora coralii]
MNHLMKHGFKISLGAILQIFIVGILLIALNAIPVIIFISIFAAKVTFLFENNMDPSALYDDLGVGVIIFMVFFVIYLSFTIFLVNTYITNGLYRASIQSVFNRRVSISDVISLVFKDYLSILAVILISAVLLLPFRIFSGILSYADYPISALLVDFMIGFMSLVFVLYSPILIIHEKLGVWKSIQTSFKIFTKKFGKAFIGVLIFIGIPSVMFGFYMLFSFLIALAVGAVDSGIDGELTPLFFVTVFLFILVFISVIYPIVNSFTILLTVNYYRKQIRPHFFITEEEPHLQTTDETPSFTFEPHQAPNKKDDDESPSH